MVALHGCMQAFSSLDIPDSPGESGLISNGSKNCALLPSRDGSILEPLSVLKGVKPPVEFAEKTRDGSSGHAGNESPHFAMTGSSGDFSRDASGTIRNTCMQFIFVIGAWTNQDTR